MTQFGTFSQKINYFDEIYPINGIFDKIYVHKPDWNNFYELLKIKFFDKFPKILTYGVILAPKMTQFGPFSPTMTYFDQIDPINGIFNQIYVHKPDWNNF